MMRQLVDQAAAARFSSEIGRMLFWLHHASGPIAIGILTIAVTLAAFGYVAASLVWRFWSRSRWRQRGQLRDEA